MTSVKEKRNLQLSFLVIGSGLCLIGAVFDFLAHEYVHALYFFGFTLFGCSWGFRKAREKEPNQPLRPTRAYGPRG
jgi:hypothetical protein